MQTTIDEKQYGKLLINTMPRRIETEAENEKYLKIVEQLMGRSEENISPEEEKLLDLLVTLIEEFEARAYPMKQIPPNEMLKYIIEERGMKQKDLLPIFGSEGIISEILKGKRQINLRQAKDLSEFLKVNVSLFI